MDSFIVKAVTPDGNKFNGKAQLVSLKTLQGEMGILAHHTDYIGVIENCIVKIIDDCGKELFAVLGGGFVTVEKGEVTLASDYMVFSNEIDRNELEKSKAIAVEKLEKCSDKREKAILKSQIHRIELKEKIIDK